MTPSEITKIWDSKKSSELNVKRGWPFTEEVSYPVEQKVRGILNRVREMGDKALMQYTRWFDGIDLQPSEMRLTAEKISLAYEQVGRAEIDAMRVASERLREVVERTRDALSFSIDLSGTTITQRLEPLTDVGCYVPGGEAAYPSSLLMCAIPAQVAGVKRIVVCTPPREDGVSPLTLIAADMCNVEEIYQIGGAQAIAAMAFGTESIPPVQKIVGPGNKYVALAKRMVSDNTLIDMPAGPSELLVIADESANAGSVALDMISQAEHGDDAVSILVTISEGFASEVLAELERLVGTSPRQKQVRNSLGENGGIFCVDTLDDCITFANDFAAEHVQIMTKNPREVAERIRNAGLVLLGEYTPVAASDYGLGVNHVLPTKGYAKLYSGLSVLDFVRLVRIVELSKEGLEDISDALCTLAKAEGLSNHARAIQGRFGL